MGVFWLRLVERLFWEESEWCVMVMSPVMLGKVPEWVLVGALWAAVGVFVMSAFTCYAWRRMMAVPGVAEGRADSVRASVACAPLCRLFWLWGLACLCSRFAAV